jgi:hypothetical protein
MNVKNSIGKIWWLKLPVAPNNRDHHFSKLFNVEETKGIIHSRIYPACDVVQSVWYNISALIGYNFIIKNYVNRKITSYIYLLIFTISLWLHVKHFITLKHEKGKYNYWSGLSLSTHRPVTTKYTGKYDGIGDKKESMLRIK